MAGYPSYRYHATEAPVVVNDEAEEKALGKGWADSPAAFASEADLADVADETLPGDVPAKKGKGKK